MRSSFIFKGNTNSCVEVCLRLSSFYGVAKLGFFILDYHLINALVERWCLETHSTMMWYSSVEDTLISLHIFRMVMKWTLCQYRFDNLLPHFLLYCYSSCKCDCPIITRYLQWNVVKVFYPSWCMRYWLLEFKLVQNSIWLVPLYNMKINKWHQCPLNVPSIQTIWWKSGKYKAPRSFDLNDV